MLNDKTINQLKADLGWVTFTQLLRVFENESAKQVHMLCEKPFIDDDSERLCHSLKSSAKSYGAEQLAILAEQLEYSVQQSDEETYLTLLSQLTNTHQGTLNALSLLMHK